MTKGDSYFAEHWGGRIPRGMADLRTVAGEQGFPASTSTKCKRKLAKCKQIWGGGKFFLFSSLWHTEQAKDECCGERGVWKPAIHEHDDRNRGHFPSRIVHFPEISFEIAFLSSLPPFSSTFSFNRVLLYGSGWLPIRNLLASAS